MNSVIKESTEWNAWRAELEVAQVRTTEKMKGSYACPELTVASVRIGADDHKQHPSLRGRIRRYQNGREESVNEKTRG